jgi:hypothetical protein
MSHNPHREDLPGPSELLVLLEIDFEEIGPGARERLGRRR